VAYRYRRHEVPADDELAADVLDMTVLLQVVYQAQIRTPAPGDPAPEVVEAELIAQELAGRRVPSRSGFRMTAKHRIAIELRAMKIATEYYARRGGEVKDVSASSPFDLEVLLDGVRLSVEVKGTAGDGAEILLTRGEVSHHLQAHPANALVVVSGIHCEGQEDAPEAVGGELTVVSPWLVNEDALTALSYRYAVSDRT
jgi:hypothetical protein